MLFKPYKTFTILKNINKRSLFTNVIKSCFYIINALLIRVIKCIVSRLSLEYLLYSLKEKARTILLTEYKKIFVGIVSEVLHLNLKNLNVLMSLKRYIKTHLNFIKIFYKNS